jgi:hypothetical protein
MHNEYINKSRVKRIWSTRNDPLYDNSDAGAILYKDAKEQHYLRVFAWGGGEHVMRITAAEAAKILARNDYRRVFWKYLGDQLEAQRRGDDKRAKQLEARMHLTWEIGLTGRCDHPGNPNQVGDADLCDAISGLMKKHPDWNFRQLAAVLRTKYGVTEQFLRRFYQVFFDSKQAGRRKRGF